MSLPECKHFYVEHKQNSCTYVKFMQKTSRKVSSFLQQCRKFAEISPFQVITWNWIWQGEKIYSDAFFLHHLAVLERWWNNLCRNYRIFLYHDLQSHPTDITFREGEREFSWIEKLTNLRFFLYKRRFHNIFFWSKQQI